MSVPSHGMTNSIAAIKRWVQATSLNMEAETLGGGVQDQA